MFLFFSYLFCIPGVELKPGAKKNFELREGEMLHINMASFGEKLVDKTGRSVVMVTCGEGAKPLAICALTAGKIESFNVDISFSGEENVVLEVVGKNTVHLTGNFGYAGELDDSDAEDEEGMLINEYSDDEASEGDSDDGESDGDIEPQLLPDSDPPVITELPDDGKNGGLVAKKQGRKANKVKAIEAPKAKQEQVPAKGNGKAQAKQIPQHDDDDNGEGDGEKNGNDNTDVGDSKEQKIETPTAKQSVGKKNANAGPSSGKKRGNQTLDAGQTPAGKKARKAEGSGNVSAKKTRPEKETNGGGDTPNSAAVKKNSGGGEAKGTPKQAQQAPPKDAAATPGSSNDGEGDSAKSSGKRKRRRRSKGSSGAA